MKLDYDFNGEAYYTVSGQNSNNSVRIPNSFFKAVEEDGDWQLHLPHRTARSPRRSRPATCGTRSPTPPGAAPTPACSTTTRSTSGTPAPSRGRINASNPCVTGDTRVLTPGGIWRRIDQMIHLPARVVTNLDGQEIHVTEGAFPTGTKDVFELRTAGGYSVKLTADHKVWTRTAAGSRRRTSSTSDEIRLPSKPACVQEIGEPQDAAFFQLLGLFVSERNADGRRLHLDACLRDADLIDDFARYVADNWGERLYDDDYVNAADARRRRATPMTTTPRTGNDATATLTNRRLLSRLQGLRPHRRTATRRLGDERSPPGWRRRSTCSAACSPPTASSRNNSIELQSDEPRAARRRPAPPARLRRARRRFRRRPALNDSDERRRSLRWRRPARSTGGCAAHAATRSRAGRLAVAATQTPDATACVSIRAASALLANTSACCRAESSSSSPTPSSLRDRPPTATAVGGGNWDRVASFTPIGKQQVFDLTEPVTSSLRRQRADRPQLLGIHVPRRHGVQPGVAERPHVLRRREPPVRHRRLQARHPPLDDRAGDLAC